MSKNGIVVIGPVFVDIKGYPLSSYNPLTEGTWAKSGQSTAAYRET